MTLLEIVERTVPEISDIAAIHAMWLEGSYASGQFNEKSDIDVWLDVNDDTFEQAYEEFLSILKTTVNVRKIEKLKLYSQEPPLAKAKFYLEDKTDDQRIELDIQQHSRNFEFTPGENVIKVLFDKDRTIKWKNI